MHSEPSGANPQSRKAALTECLPRKAALTEDLETDPAEESTAGLEFGGVEDEKARLRNQLTNPT
jgi:hypothetical protein